MHKSYFNVSSFNDITYNQNNNFDENHCDILIFKGIFTALLLSLPFWLVLFKFLL